MKIMEKNKDDELWKYLPILVIVLFLIVALSQPYFEMRAFNKFRKSDQPKATYVVALFSNLRITSE